MCEGVVAVQYNALGELQALVQTPRGLMRSTSILRRRLVSVAGGRVLEDVDAEPVRASRREAGPTTTQAEQRQHYRARDEPSLTLI